MPTQGRQGMEDGTGKESSGRQENVHLDFGRRWLVLRICQSLASGWFGEEFERARQSA